jgi:hypothetical protein
MSHPARRLPADRYLSAALDYAGHGWPVFLLGRSKRPVANCPDCRLAGTDHDREACPCLTCHGFYAATTDPDRIHALFDAVPDGLLAIRTGTVSGLFVVDIDPRHGGHIDRALMVPTATVATGGDGWHLYYAYPGQPIGTDEIPGHPGVDLKHDGGYVVAPPSVHPATKHPYRWVGDRPITEVAPALIAACLAPIEAPRRSSRPVIDNRRAGAISNPAALLAAHLDAVARAPEGTRRKTLYGAARGVARMVAAGAITRTDAVAALTDAGRDAQQTDRQIRDAITGGFRAEGETL